MEGKTNLSRRLKVETVWCLTWLTLPPDFTTDLCHCFVLLLATSSVIGWCTAAGVRYWMMMKTSTTPRWKSRPVHHRRRHHHQSLTSRRRQTSPDVTRRSVHRLRWITITSAKYVHSTNLYTCCARPLAGSEVVRIDPLCFVAGCRKKRLNQALSVLSLSLDFWLCLLCC